MKFVVPAPMPDTCTFVPVDGLPLKVKVADSPGSSTYPETIPPDDEWRPKVIVLLS